jgi:hypothetical protein
MSKTGNSIVAEAFSAAITQHSYDLGVFLSLFFEFEFAFGFFSISLSSPTVFTSLSYILVWFMFVILMMLFFFVVVVCIFVGYLFVSTFFSIELVKLRYHIIVKKVKKIKGGSPLSAHDTEANNRLRSKGVT